jgi:hypothetical protein
MRTFAELAMFAGILAASLCCNSTISWSKPEYARRTKKECSFCHPADSWNLNDAGKYYRDHNDSLQGYKPPSDNKHADKQRKS